MKNLTANAVMFYKNEIDARIKEIYRLKSQNARLREALTCIAEGKYIEGEESWIAKQALSEGKE